MSDEVDQDVEEGRAWYGQLDDHPAIPTPDATARTTITVPYSVIREYTADEDPLGAGPIPPTIVGAIAAMTARHWGYRITTIESIETEGGEALVDVEVTTEVIGS